MKTLRLLTMTAALALALTTTSHAATAIVDDGTSFTAGMNDISNLFPYTPGEYDSGSGFTNGAQPGQTFLTSSAGPLDSITLQKSSGSGGGYENDVITLGVFSVSGSNLTYLGGENYTFGGSTIADADYFTLNLTTPIELFASTEYAFTFNDTTGGGYLGLVSSGPGYDPSDSTSDTYPIGTAIDGSSAPTASQTFSVPTNNGSTYDRAFDIGIGAVPEPTTWALMLGGVAALVGISRFRRQTL